MRLESMMPCADLVSFISSKNETAPEKNKRHPRMVNPSNILRRIPPAVLVCFIFS